MTSPQTGSEGSAGVMRAVPRPEPGRSTVAEKAGRRESEGEKGGVMSLLALFIICAVVIGIGIASTLVTR